MSGLDWTQISAFQKTVTTVTPKPASATDLITNAQGMVWDVLKGNQAGFNFRGIPQLPAGVTQEENLSWVDRLMSHFTNYVDGKILEFQTWFMEGFHNFADGFWMFVIYGGKVAAVFWVCQKVIKLMLSTDTDKKGEEMMNAGVMGLGLFILCCCAEKAFLGL